MTLASTLTFHMKLTSHFEEQPEQAFDGISRLISPEKVSGVSAPSVLVKTNVAVSCDTSPDSPHRLIKDLIERVAKLELIVHRMENDEQRRHPREDDECGSGISSVSDDFPTEEQLKASKCAPRGFFRFRRTRGRPGTKSRVVEV
jgi:hypothetical protein